MKNILRSAGIGGLLFLASCEATTGAGDATPTFETSFGSTADDIGYALVLDGSEILVAASTTVSGQQDLLLLRISAGGDTVWNRRYGTPNHDVPRRIFRLSDGSFAVIGSSTNLSTQDRDVMIVRIASSGALLGLSVVAQGTDNTGRDAVEHSSGDLIVVGAQQSGETTFGYIARTTTAGSIQWSRTYGGGGLNSFSGVVRLQNGNFRALGSKEVSSDNRDYWALDFTASGDSLSQRTYGTTGDEFVNASALMSDGTIFILGNTDLFGDIDGYALRINQSADSIWSRSFGALQEDDLHAITPTSDGGFVICGFTRSFGTGGDLWLNKISNAGSSIWAQPVGGNGLEKGYAIVEYGDRSFFAVGETSSFGAGGKDVYIVRTDPFGIVKPAPL